MHQPDNKTTSCTYCGSIDKPLHAIGNSVAVICTLCLSRKENCLSIITTNIKKEFTAEEEEAIAIADKLVDKE